MDFKKENKVKNTLKAREIKPSEEVWRKLEKELEENDKKTSFIIYKKIIAAVIMISFLIGGLFYFNTAEKNTEKLSVDEVNINSEEIKSTEKSVVISATKEKPKEEISSENEEETKENIQEEIAVEDKISKKSKEDIFIDKDLIIKELNENVLFLTKAINHKTEEIISAEEETKKLLAAALKSVENAKTTTKIDAENLLAEIDKELAEEPSEESQIDLKEQMQNIIKESFDKAKSALAFDK